MMEHGHDFLDDGRDGKVVEAKHLKFLDELRISGATNMFGAGEYVMEEFGVDRVEAREIVLHWMRTFEHGTPEERVTR